MWIIIASVCMSWQWCVSGDRCLCPGNRVSWTFWTRRNSSSCVLASYTCQWHCPQWVEKRFESVTRLPRRSYCYVYFQKVYHCMLGYGLVLYVSFSPSFQTFSYSHDLHWASPQGVRQDHSDSQAVKYKYVSCTDAQSASLQCKR